MIIALILAVSLSSSAYGETDQEYDIGRYLYTTTTTISTPCPNGNKQVDITEVDTHWGGYVTRRSFTDCAGNVTIALPDTTYKRIGVDAGEDCELVEIDWDGSFVNVDGVPDGAGTTGGLFKSVANPEMNKIKSRFPLPGFRTNDINVRIFEVVKDERVVVILDTVIDATAGKAVIPTDFTVTVTDNHYISVSRDFDFANDINIKDKSHKLIADYSAKNTKKFSKKMKKYGSYSVVGKINSFGNKEGIETDLSDINNAINVYPNPSHSDVNIDVKAGLSGLLKVYYVNHGSNENELVHTIRLESGITSYNIDSSVLARKGTYIVVGEVDYKNIAHAIEPIPFMIVK